MKGKRRRTSQMVRIWRNLAAHRQGWKCHWCKEPMEYSHSPTGRRLSADHVIPKHAGGLDEQSNIVAACAKCNSERTPRPLTPREKWKVDYRALRINRRTTEGKAPFRMPRHMVEGGPDKMANRPLAVLGELLKGVG